MSEAEQLEAELPETEEKKEEEKHDGFIALDKHQKDVNVQHKRFRDEERGRVSEKGRADNLQKELNELKSKQAEVEIPPVPDKYSENYEAEMVTRDSAITQQAEQNAANESVDAQRKETEEAREAEKNTAIEKSIAVFDSNTVTHGLNPANVKVAADTVIENGISEMFQDVLLEDPDGPLFVQYLASHPIEAEEMNRMSTLQLINHLNSEIRPKALLLKPKTSNAPDPPVVLDGGGAPESKESWEEGARYE